MVARARKAVFPPAPEVVSGVQFPKTSERGDRSTTVTGKAAWRGLAAELGAADVARAIDWEGNWRANYGRHVVAVAEALAAAPVDAAAEACDKTLADVSDAFEFVRDGATTTGLRAALATYDEPKLETFIVQVEVRAGQESEIPNFKASYLGRFPLVSADFWTSDHLSERSRSAGAVSETRARGTLTLKRR